MVVGLALAPALGLSRWGQVVPFAVCLAGMALLPDLDCGSATASRLLGPITGLVSRGLKFTSERLYAVTKGPRDEDWKGGHRHLSHCGLFALALGGLAAWTSTLSPWAVAGWLGLGVLLAASALGEWALLAGAGAVAVPLLADGAAPLALLAGMGGWIGLAVGLGCLVHDVGDAVTVSGVPILFPLLIAGETWWEVHLMPPGLRLHTGKRMEHWVVFPALVLAGMALVWLRLGGSLPDLGHVVRAL